MKPDVAGNYKMIMDLVRTMGINMAVLLDELVQLEGELQVKRIKRGIGSTWELTVWEPRADNGNGSKSRAYPIVKARLHANTAHELVQALEAKLEELAPAPEYEQLALAV